MGEDDETFDKNEMTSTARDEVDRLEPGPPSSAPARLELRQGSAEAEHAPRLFSPASSWDPRKRQHRSKLVLSSRVPVSRIRSSDEPAFPTPTQVTRVALHKQLSVSRQDDGFIGTCDPTDERVAGPVPTRRRLSADHAAPAQTVSSTTLRQVGDDRDRTDRPAGGHVKTDSVGTSPTRSRPGPTANSCSATATTPSRSGARSGTWRMPNRRWRPIGPSSLTADR